MVSPVAGGLLKGGEYCSGRAGDSSSTLIPASAASAEPAGLARGVSLDEDSTLPRMRCAEMQRLLSAHRQRVESQEMEKESDLFNFTSDKLLN